MNSIWYLVYEGGETHLGYEIGRIRIVLLPSTPGGNAYTPVALFFGRNESVRIRKEGAYVVDWLVSEVLRELRKESPSGGPYQAILASPPHNEQDYATA